MDENSGKVIEKKLAGAPKEQEVIGLVRRHHRSGKSNYVIAKYLNEKGFKTKMGKSWTGVPSLKPCRVGVIC